MKLRPFTKFFLLLLVCLLIQSKLAFAYLDPGTGSYFFQIILATALGVAFSVKMFWKNVFALIRKILSKNHARKRSS